MPSLTTFNRQKGFAPIILLIGVLVITLAAGGAYYYYQSKQKLSTYSPPTPTNNTVQTTPSPTPNPTANWETYENAYYSFKYPDDWDLEIDSKKDSNEIIPSVYIHYHYTDDPSKGRYNFYFGDSIRFSIIKAVSNSNLDIYIQEIINNQGNIVSKIKDVVIDGIKGRRFTFGGQFSADTIYAKRDDLIFNISHNEVVDKSHINSIDETTYNQILSTFRFLDPDRSIDISDWKTYRNDKYGFEFKYPEEIVVEEIKPTIQEPNSSNVPQYFELWLSKESSEGISIDILSLSTLKKDERLGFPNYSLDNLTLEKETIIKSTINSDCSYLLNKFNRENECKITQIGDIKMIDRIMLWPPGAAPGRSFSFYNNDLHYDIIIFSDDLYNDKMGRPLTIKESNNLPNEDNFKLFYQILSTFKFTQ